MHDFVTEIRKGGFKTGLISNNVKEWQPAWDKVIPTRDLFDATIFFRRRLAAGNQTQKSLTSHSMN